MTMGKKIIDEQIQEIIHLHESGLKNYEIAEITGIAGSTIGAKLKSNGLQSQFSYKHLTEDEQNLILKMHTEGVEAHIILKKLERSDSQCVHRFLVKKGLTPIQYTNPNALLIEDGNGFCKFCNKLLPLTNFYFQKINKKYNPKCRQCMQKKDQERISTNIDVFLRRTVKGIKNRNKTSIISHNYLLEMWENQEGKCFYTDTPMTHLRGSGQVNTNCSVDQIIPQGGYREGNIILCTRRSNAIKNDLTLEEMKLWMPTWYDRIMAGYESGLLY